MSLRVLYDLLTWTAVGVAGLLVWALLAFCVGTVIGRVADNRDQQRPAPRTDL